MNAVISPGDRVMVTPNVRGYARKPFKGTVISWTRSGRLKVKVDGHGLVNIVSSEHVKKLADGPKSV